MQIEEYYRGRFREIESLSLYSEVRSPPPYCFTILTKGIQSTATLPREFRVNIPFSLYGKVSSHALLFCRTSEIHAYIQY